MRNEIGIFLIAAATLLLEISLSRIFSVLFFHHFAFLIISTALFGFGFSGIILFLRKPDRAALPARLSTASLLFAVTMLIVYRIILQIPATTREIMNQPSQVVQLILNYALLAIPFFFSGYIVGALLTSFPEKSGRLYSFDLIGAALGCISVLWLVPTAGGSGAIITAALIGTLASIVFSAGRKLFASAGVCLALFCVILLFSPDKYFPFQINRIVEEKYGFRAVLGDRPEYSKWSPVSRIDVYPAGGSNKILMLDGGSNVSLMVPFDGNLGALRPQMNWRVVPFVISPRKSVAIIGPGGGEDVLNALSHRAESIAAVEMDPLIVELVQGRYRKFIGGIYNVPSVKTVNDEGRSYLRRSKEQFDLIQQVHNISPIAIASGALNLSESYLLTIEAFREYWNRLAPGGMLAINRWGILRAASIASFVLQEKGVQDPENYVIITSRQRSGADTSFHLKKGKITEQDLANLDASLNTLRVRIEYAPTAEFQKESNVYYKLLSLRHRDEFIKNADVVLKAPTDDWPFFDHFQQFGRFQQSTTVLPKELNPMLKFVNMGDLALLTLLAEAAILSLIFIIFPLLKFRKVNAAVSKWSILAYFSALGLGFILIEISLIQKHILFLGQPVYSISAVLFSILLSAGIGSSFFQSRFRDGSERKWLHWILILLAAVLFLEFVIATPLFTYFLGASQQVRFLISSLMIAPLGFVLGIPFPLGVRVLGDRSPDAIPWAWGLNAYTTIIGSILCVIFAITLGFRMNLLIAFAVYSAGILFFRYSLRKNTE